MIAAACPRFASFRRFAQRYEENGWSFSTTFGTRAANIETNCESDPKRRFIGPYDVRF